jgi:hypothetical protein
LIFSWKFKSFGVETNGMTGEDVGNEEVRTRTPCGRIDLFGWRGGMNAIEKTKPKTKEKKP